MNVFVKNTKKTFNYKMEKKKSENVKERSIIKRKKKSENVAHSIIKKNYLLSNDFWCKSITSQDAKLGS